MMRLLAFEIQNTNLFGEKLHIDLFATDKVSHLITDNDNIERAFKIKGTTSIYTQNLIAFTGLNATGKTTILEVIQMILGIISHNARLNDTNIKLILHKIIGNSIDINNPVTFIVWFVLDNQIFELTSRIVKKYNAYNEDIFIYEDEIIKVQSIARLNKKYIFNFDKPIKVLKRNDYINDDTFLLEDVSIISMYKNKDVKFMSSFEKYNIARFIQPRIPDVSVIQCFDSAIRNIKESHINDKYILQFKKENSEYNLSYNELETILSSGTVKALHFFPAIQSILETGGYILFDEIENHINKRLVEWILSLFENREFNPHGACLIFSTHYPELLDTFVRKDNIYITRKDIDGTIEAVKYSDDIKRNELLKSNVILGNLIKGTVPKYASMKAAEKALMGTIK